MSLLDDKHRAMTVFTYAVESATEKGQPIACRAILHGGSSDPKHPSEVERLGRGHQPRPLQPGRLMANPIAIFESILPRLIVNSRRWDLRAHRATGRRIVVSGQIGQLSVVSCQLSVVSCQWSVVSGQLSVVGGFRDFGG
jgi:hypothetical protein